MDDASLRAIAEASPASEPNPIPDAGALEPVAFRHCRNKSGKPHCPHPTFCKEKAECYYGEAAAQQSDHIQALQAAEAEIERLKMAARRVLAGLEARIAAADSRAVPLFDGIADLHDAVNGGTGV